MRLFISRRNDDCVSVNVTTIWKIQSGDQAHRNDMTTAKTKRVVRRLIIVERFALALGFTTTLFEPVDLLLLTWIKHANRILFLPGTFRFESLDEMFFIWPDSDRVVVSLISSFEKFVFGVKFLVCGLYARV